MAAQLNHRQQLAILGVGSTDRFGSRLINAEHGPEYGQRHLGCKWNKGDRAGPGDRCSPDPEPQSNSTATLTNLALIGGASGVST